MSHAAMLAKMRDYFASGATRSEAFRKEQLIALKHAIKKNEAAINEALYADLHKSPEEVWVAEIGIVLEEINNALKNLHRWMRPKKVRTNLLNLPSSSRIEAEPFGLTLIIAPWNYPFQLLLNPLVGAIAAGNCAVLKPSELAPATSALLKKLIDETFAASYIVCLEGDGAKVVPALMNDGKFDHIFYTGSTTVGRIVYKLAADQLIPVTLELGGKSPCVIESDAALTVAAKRIALTKYNNAGQICVAPDYILVHASVKEKFITELKKTLTQFFSEDPSQSLHYGRIINEKQFDRLVNYLSQGNVVYGGQHDRATKYIAPTLLEDVSLDSPVMNEEIFGPLLPILSFQTREEALAIINRHPNPLAFYVYTNNSTHEKEWLQKVPAGGACVNNSIFHLLNHHLPFGGRGNSGLGAYHGKYSFNTFSHQKAVLRTPIWPDPSLKYPPFKGKLGLLKKLLG
ncbi:MAG: aldehyde dehydrogenase [Chitinophagaceae bacterium]|jgi:aldehyde dehydrogenase (NAD+)